LSVSAVLIIIFIEFPHENITKSMMDKTSSPIMTLTNVDICHRGSIFCWIWGQSMV
jgi:hypothetical protein